MTPLPLRAPIEPQLSGLTPAEEAIARSVLYAALFDYPLTLSQLRQTLIGSLQMPSAILDIVHRSAPLSNIIEQQDGYFFPVGRSDLIETRVRREARSRAFLAAHQPLLRLIAGLPYVRMVALSGSIAHLNLEAGGDLDLFIVTRGSRVWSTGVAVVLLAKLLRRRGTLCANYIVADSDLEFGDKDLFTANQVINLQPLTGYDVFREILRRNPFVTQFYPNFHPSGARVTRLHQSRLLRAARSLAESVLVVPSFLGEWVCRTAYRTYLRRRATTWQSPEQVVLGDRVLKLHTRSHRRTVLDRFDDSVHRTIGDR